MQQNVFIVAPATNQPPHQATETAAAAEVSSSIAPAAAALESTVPTDMAQPEPRATTSVPIFVRLEDALHDERPHAMDRDDGSIPPADASAVPRAARRPATLTGQLAADTHPAKENSLLNDVGDPSASPQERKTLWEQDQRLERMRRALGIHTADGDDDETRQAGAHGPRAEVVATDRVIELAHDLEMSSQAARARRQTLASRARDPAASQQHAGTSSITSPPRTNKAAQLRGGRSGSATATRRSVHPVEWATTPTTPRRGVGSSDAAVAMPPEGYASPFSSRGLCERAVDVRNAERTSDDKVQFLQDWERDLKRRQQQLLKKQTRVETAFIAVQRREMELVLMENKTRDEVRRARHKVDMDTKVTDQIMRQTLGLPSPAGGPSRRNYTLTITDHRDVSTMVDDELAMKNHTNNRSGALPVEFSDAVRSMELHQRSEMLIQRELKLAAMQRVQEAIERRRLSKFRALQSELYKSAAALQTVARAMRNVAVRARQHNEPINEFALSDVNDATDAILAALMLCSEQLLAEPGPEPNVELMTSPRSVPGVSRDPQVDRLDATRALRAESKYGGGVDRSGVDRSGHRLTTALDDESTLPFDML